MRKKRSGRVPFGMTHFKQQVDRLVRGKPAPGRAARTKKRRTP